MQDLWPIIRVERYRPNIFKLWYTGTDDFEEPELVLQD